MEEGNTGKSWVVWVLLVAAGMTAGAFITKWAVGRSGRGAPVSPQAAARTAPAPESPAETEPEPAPVETAFDLPGDEPEGNAAVVWGKTASAPAPAAPAASARNAQPAKASAVDDDKSRETGFVYGALSKAAEKLLRNPKALAALFNNDYVVKGFMSRDTVKSATANKASLAAYLSSPANLSKFMSKPAVQGGINNQQLVNVMASTKLVGNLMDTPGGKALLNDPVAIAGILKANPELASLLSNPSIAMAMAQNPKTAGMMSQIQLR